MSRGFIKLTRVEGLSLWVNPGHIDAIGETEGANVFVIVGGERWFLSETPEDIAIIMAEAEGSPEYALDLPEEVRGLVREVRPEQERLGQDGIPTDAHLADLQMLDEIREAVGCGGEAPSLSHVTAPVGTYRWAVEMAIRGHKVSLPESRFLWDSGDLGFANPTEGQMDSDKWFVVTETTSEAAGGEGA